MTTAASLAALDPMHRGHHPVYQSPEFHVDICNMVDDVVVAQRDTDTIYRFPITEELLPWLTDLLETMNFYDSLSGNERQRKNAIARASLLLTARLRLDGNPPRLNVYEPGPVREATGPTGVVDDMLEEIIRTTPDALVGVAGQAWNPSRIIEAWAPVSVA